MNATKTGEETRLYALIGFPLTHSFSERYFTAKFEKEGIKNTGFKSLSFENINTITEIIKDPTVGEPKQGDLAGVFVYKFRCNGQLTLLAYEYDAESRQLLLLGSHENFYRTLKR